MRKMFSLRSILLRLFSCFCLLLLLFPPGAKKLLITGQSLRYIRVILVKQGKLAFFLQQSPEKKR